MLTSFGGTRTFTLCFCHNKYIVYRYFSIYRKDINISREILYSTLYLYIDIMPTVLIIERNGTVKQHNIKTFSLEDLYKKIGFKSKEGFSRNAVWNVSVEGESYSIELYGKTVGRAGQENKYEFPPPVENVLFFGSCVLVNRRGEDVANLFAKEWKQIYETLYGGFDDIGEDSSEDETEEDGSKGSLTKEGYVKNGFVVDSEEEEDESVDSVPAPPLAKPVAKQTPRAPRKSAKKTKGTPEQERANIDFRYEEKPTPEPPVENTYLNCVDELQEEEYM